MDWARAAAKAGEVGGAEEESAVPRPRRRDRPPPPPAVPDEEMPLILLFAFRRRKGFGMVHCIYYFGSCFGCNSIAICIDFIDLCDEETTSRSAVDIFSLFAGVVIFRVWMLLKI